jgi:hypothetical protein
MAHHSPIWSVDNHKKIGPHLAQAVRRPTGCQIGRSHLQDLEVLSPLTYTNLWETVWSPVIFHSWIFKVDWQTVAPPGTSLMRKIHKPENGRKKPKLRAKDKKTVKIMLLQIASLDPPRSIIWVTLFYICSETRWFPNYFLPSFPCQTKPKHWTRGLQRQLAAKRARRSVVGESSSLE